MGFLRLALAVAVLFGHFAPAHLLIIDAPGAVQAFFLISGFYIFMILDGKYADARTFYINRALRLYPSYLFVVVCALIAAATMGASAHYYTLPELIDRYRQLDLWAAVFLLFANLTMFFQDTAMFVKIEGSSLGLSTHVFWDQNPAYKLLIVPQAWSVGIELSFYLFAPLLARIPSLALIALVLGAFIIRLAFYSMGLPFYADPFSLRYFPLELPLFLIGGLMYRVTDHFRDRLDPRVGVTLIVVLIAYVLLYRALPGWRLRWFVIKYDVFLILVAASLPFLHTAFELRGANKLLGELSYPIYLNHLFVYNVLVMVRPRWMDPTMFLFAGLASSIALALLMVWLIEEPVDRIRQRIAARQ